MGQVTWGIVFFFEGLKNLELGSFFFFFFWLLAFGKFLFVLEWTLMRIYFWISEFCLLFAKKIGGFKFSLFRSFPVEVDFVLDEYTMELSRPLGRPIEPCGHMIDFWIFQNVKISVILSKFVNFFFFQNAFLVQNPVHGLLKIVLFELLLTKYVKKSIFENFSKKIVRIILMWLWLINFAEKLVT